MDVYTFQRWSDRQIDLVGGVLIAEHMDKYQMNDGGDWLIS